MMLSMPFLAHAGFKAAPASLVRLRFLKMGTGQKSHLRSLAYEARLNLILPVINWCILLESRPTRLSPSVRVSKPTHCFSDSLTKSFCGSSVGLSRLIRTESADAALVYCGIRAACDSGSVVATRRTVLRQPQIGCKGSVPACISWL